MPARRSAGPDTVPRPGWIRRARGVRITSEKTAPVTTEIPGAARWDLAKREADVRSEVYGAAPVPVTEIAERNGVEVVLANFGRNRDLVSGICDFQNRKIFVNAADIFPRRRFTIAHELGHWILHRSFYESDPDGTRSCPDSSTRTTTVRWNRKPTASPRTSWFPADS